MEAADRCSDVASGAMVDSESWKLDPLVEAVVHPRTAVAQNYLAGAVSTVDGVLEDGT